MVACLCELGNKINIGSIFHPPTASNINRLCYNLNYSFCDFREPFCKYQYLVSKR